MRYHLFQNFFGKMVKIKKTSFHSTREDTNFLPPLYLMEQLFKLSKLYRIWKFFIWIESIRVRMPKTLSRSHEELVDRLFLLK